MTPDDLQKMNSDELQKLRAKVDEALAQLDYDEMHDAIITLRGIAARRGQSLLDLVRKAEETSMGMPYRPKPRSGRGRVAHRHPTMEGLYWYGRGRAPSWVIEYEKAGGDRKDLIEE